ncbi:hypothetical protein HHI36_005654, partial [Cryptolaemus montrouzieri]
HKSSNIKNVRMSCPKNLSEKNSLLHKSIRENKKEIVSKLLNEGARVNGEDINRNTPLHVAAENGNVEIAKILLEFNADVCAKDIYGRTALDAAFWNGDERLILALLEKTKNINISTNNREDSPLHLAAELCSPDLVKWLLRKGADVNAKKYRGKTPLHVAALRGNASITEILIDFGADYNNRDEEGETPLLIASRHGNEEVVSILLKYEVNVNIRVRRGETALHLLIENKVHEKTIRMLLSKGVDVNTGSIINRTSLHICAIYGHSEIAQTLLEFGADPDLQDANGQTSLHLACMQGNEGVIQVLLQHGIRIDLKNELGKTPLHYAALFGCSKILYLLLTRGANPNVRNVDGRTPLAYSVCETYNSEIVHLLLQYGANINCIDRYGLTPLHIAGRAAGREMVSLLLDLGADINATDWEDRTPLSIALSFQEENRGTIITLENHVVMRKTAGLYVCEENLESLRNDEYLDHFRNACEKEVEVMKKTKIGKSNISHHYILTRSIHELVKVARNRDVDEGLKAVNYIKEFPLYGKMIEPIIKRNFCEALIRKDLLEEGLKLFSVAFEDFPKLPQHCIDVIFIHLRNQDIRNWIKAFRK